MKTSESIVEIAGALSTFQGALISVKKNAKGYNYNYADLADVWDSIRLLIAENGLSVVQDAVSLPEGTSVTTRVSHKSGQWIECGPLTVLMTKKDAHATGSAITYARRYALCAALGIVSEEPEDKDDDGVEANQCAPSPSNKTNNTLSADEVKNWLAEAEKDYAKTDIIAFLKHKSEQLRIKGDEVVTEFAKNKAGFKKEFESWLAKNKPSNDDEDGKKVST